jgi:surfactin synthase thioesterase subunit
MSADGKWFHVTHPRPGARLRLFCFHYAGGAAQMYNSWQRRFSPDVEVVAVQMPGRWTRLKEPLLRSVESMARSAAAAIEPLCDRPYAVFGHSLGAAVGFELIHTLAEMGAPPPVRFFASARNAPHRPSVIEPLHRLPDEEFIRVLRDNYGALPKEILDDPEMRPIFLNVLRADLEAIESYRPAPRAPFAAPITAMGGRRDFAVDETQLAAWSELTTGGFELAMFDGDHFYIRTEEASVIQAIEKALEPELLTC